VTQGTVSQIPFPHLQIPALLASDEADSLLLWFETSAPWQLRIESFYEQHEFSLLDESPPGGLRTIIDDVFIGELCNLIRSSFSVCEALELVGISAHRLTPRQTIRIHNDYIGEEETHRVLVQLNRGWTLDNGGLLMLFDGERAEEVRAVISPTHGSAFVFEISPRSFHAVSTIRSGERYTLVYTFRKHVHR
jgi:hypothetical protein